jgi:hypothetical protein
VGRLELRRAGDGPLVVSQRAGQVALLLAGGAAVGVGHGPLRAVGQQGDGPVQLDQGLVVVALHQQDEGALGVGGAEGWGVLLHVVQISQGRGPVLQVAVDPRPVGVGRHLVGAIGQQPQRLLEVLQRGRVMAMLPALDGPLQIAVAVQRLVSVAHLGF